MAFGVIYLLTNLANGRYYVGQTIQAPEARFRQHVNDAKRKNGPLQAALVRYGSAGFSLEILGEAESIDELNKLESLWILFLGATTRGVGYNCRTGGDSQIPNELTRTKLSLSHMGQKRTVEQIEKAASANRGRKRSSASLERLTAAAKKRSSALASEERVAMSERMRQRMTGRTPWNKGKRGLQTSWNKGVPMPQDHPLRTVHLGRTLSDDHRKKISDALKGRMPAVNQRRLKASTAA